MGDLLIALAIYAAVAVIANVARKRAIRKFHSQFHDQQEK